LFDHKIIGKAAEVDPGSEIDFGLLQVSALHKVPSSVTFRAAEGDAGGAGAGSTATTTTLTTLPSTTTQPSTTTLTSATSAATLDTSINTMEVNNKKDLSRASSSTGTTSEHDQPPPDETGNKKVISWPRDDLCPFREYRRLAQQAPRGTITIITLGQILAPLGCTSCQVGACFFELDERNVGHVHWNHNDGCLEEKLVQITNKYCPEVKPQAVRAALQCAQEENLQKYHWTEDGADPRRCCC
jgi:hypothetical protein